MATLDDIARQLQISKSTVSKALSGAVDVSDAMRRHIITLEREQEDLIQSKSFCDRLKDEQIRLCDLDAGSWLEEMKNMESKGVTFQNKQRGDVKRKRYAATALAAAVMVILMLGIIALLVWAFSADPVGAPPWPLVVFLIAIPAVVVLGVLIALGQRWREIKEGEEDEARKY